MFCLVLRVQYIHLKCDLNCLSGIAQNKIKNNRGFGFSSSEIKVQIIQKQIQSGRTAYALSVLLFKKTTFV